MDVTPPMQVTLRPVPPSEHDDYFAMMAPYHAELDIYDPYAGDVPSAEAYRRAVLDDMAGRELLWIEADGERAGFVMMRVDPDWPDETRLIASIAEFYVAPLYRRRGIGSAAVQAILDDHRARGTFEVEAGILRDNSPALEFWRRMGFELRAYQTARRP